MPQCPSCAAPTTGASRRCPECGHVAGAAGSLPAPTPPAARELFRPGAPGLPPPPPPRRRRLPVLTGLAALAVTAVAATGIALSARSGEQTAGDPAPSASPRPSPSASPSIGYAGVRTGTILLAATSGGALEIDVDAGLTRPVSVDIGPFEGFDSIPVAALGTSQIVYVVGEELVLAPVGRRTRGQAVGTGVGAFADTNGRTFWGLAQAGPQVLTEYDGTGRRLRSVVLPPGAVPLAAVRDGILVLPRPGEDPLLQLISFRGRVLREWADAQFVAATPDTILWASYVCASLPGGTGCGLTMTRLPGGETVQLPFAYQDARLTPGSGGCFSPDGKRLAVFEDSGTPGASRSRATVVTIASRTAIAVPGPQMDIADGSCAWSPDSRWLFYSPGSRWRGRIAGYDLQTGQTAEFPRIRFDQIDFLQ